MLSAERPPVQEVARRAGVSRPAVWGWQVRYAEQGVDGLLRDKTRKPGRAPLPTATVAKAVGISLRAVQCIWEAIFIIANRLSAF